MANHCKHASESEVTFTQLMLPSHANFGGKIHGGYILSLMDQIAFACASKHSGVYCVTASVGFVDFLNPIDVGELVSMKAAINHVGKRSMVVGIRVESENIKTGKRKHCNSSYFTMVAKKGEEGEPHDVPGLVIKTKNEARRYVEAIKRKESKFQEKKLFDKDNFNISSHEEELQKGNLRLELSHDE